MTDSNEPKNETGRKTASPPLPKPLPPPAAEPPSPARTAAATMPAPMTTHATKKETARITVLPDPSAKPAVEMKKTQPLIDLPAVETPAARVTVAPTPQPISRIDEIPMRLCWALFAASAATLILQIWNYVS